MSQESNWNLIDRYVESLHSSEVVNARELKFCEVCGVLSIRLQKSKALFCPDCEQQTSIAIEKIQ